MCERGKDIINLWNVKFCHSENVYLVVHADNRITTSSIVLVMSKFFCSKERAK